MAVVFQALQTIAGLAALVCYIMVIVKMFQNGKAGLGIVTLILTPCCFGGLIAFVYGWMKANEWNLKNVMLIWTVVIIVAIVSSIVGGPLIDVSQFQTPPPPPL